MGSDVISFSTLKKDDFGDLLPTGYNLDIDSSLAVHELGSAVRVRVRGMCFVSPLYYIMFKAVLAYQS
jgi:hypothetical protein